MKSKSRDIFIHLYTEGSIEWRCFLLHILLSIVMIPLSIVMITLSIVMIRLSIVTMEILPSLDAISKHRGASRSESYH